MKNHILTSPIIEQIEVYAEAKKVYFGIACHKRVDAAIESNKPFFVFFDHGEVSHEFMEHSVLFFRILSAKKMSGDILFIDHKRVTLVSPKNWKWIKNMVLGDNAETVCKMRAEEMTVNVRKQKYHASAVIAEAKKERMERANMPKPNKPENIFEIGKDVVRRHKPSLHGYERTQMLAESRERMNGITMCQTLKMI